MNILVRNLNQKTTSDHLYHLFVKFGVIYFTKIIKDDFNGISSGVGYLKMDKSPGAAAIYELNNVKFMNFYIDVSEVPM